MAQALKILSVTVSSAGTAQRVVSDATSVYRYVPWVYFEASADNGGLIYVGDADVASDNYTTVLDAAQSSKGINFSAFQYDQSPSAGVQNEDLWDLYNMWVDTSNNGDVVFVTVPTQQ